MKRPESVIPVRMCRIAVVAPAATLGAALRAVAASGSVDLDRDEIAGRTADVVVANADDAAAPGPVDAALRARVDAAVLRGRVAAVAGWCPATTLESLRAELRPHGASVVVLPAPPGVDPPTLLAGGPRIRRAFAPLVGLYGVVPYRDVDPSSVAGLVYLAMFGMMFGDAGHGLLLVAAGLALASGRIARLESLRRLWVFVVGAGVAAIVFGILYGEFFGPTGVLPVLWLSPLASPVRLLITAVVAGAALLGGAYALGVVNRWREGGARLALYAPAGLAGALTFAGAAAVAGGLLLAVNPLVVTGGVVAGVGVVLAAAGMVAESGGGSGAIVRAGAGIVELVTHLVANLVSFTRLAAFGMTHAALGWVVWQGTIGAARWAYVGIPCAIAVFVLGNAVAFALEALVAGVQALRLEFYELFSRIFTDVGRPFSPWRLPLPHEGESAC